MPDGQSPGNMVYEMAVAALRLRGHTILMDTPTCDQHQATHDNCVGCPSEKGCEAVSEKMILHAAKLAMDHLRSGRFSDADMEAIKRMAESSGLGDDLREIMRRLEELD